MANTIKPKRSYTASNTPTLASGELGINATDGKIWIGNAAGNANVLVSSLAFSDHTGTVSNTQLSTTAVTAGSYTNSSITVNAQGRITAASSGTASGTVTSVGLTVPTGLTITGSPVTTSGTLAVTLTSGYSIPLTASQTNWDTAYTNNLRWDGGATSLVAGTGRTSLGATTIGANLFTLTNPTAITFPRFNADNTVSALDAATFRTAIGAGTSSTSGTVTSIATTSPITGGTITSTGTIGINAASANTASYVVQRDASGNFSAGTITAALSGNASTATSATSATSASTATNLAGGGAGQIPYNTGSGATSFLAAGTAAQHLRSNGTSAPTWEVQGFFSGGRLTLESGVPVSSTDQTAKTTIYYTPYNGSVISIYNGTSWGSYSFSELSLTTSGLAANSNYDIFAYVSGSTVTLEYSAAWTNDTTRSSALSLLNGVYVKSSDNTRRYLGSIRSNASTQFTDSITNRLVWNFNNKVSRSMQGYVYSLSHSYNGGVREYNGGTSITRLYFITGINAETFLATVYAPVTSGGTSCNVLIAIDSTTVQFGVATVDDRPAGFTRRSITSLGQVNFGFHYLTGLQNTESAGAATYYDFQASGMLLC